MPESEIEESDNKSEAEYIEPNSPQLQMDMRAQPLLGTPVVAQTRPMEGSDIMRKSFLYQGPKLWATLDDRLKVSKTKSSFKTRLKLKCISNY